MSKGDVSVDASRRMHEYLLAQQRRKEEYWLRKYGKIIQPAPPSIGRPAQDRRHSGTGMEGGEHSPSNGGSFLPPIHNPAQQGPRGRAGNPPLFHAKEPVKNFFSRNVDRKPSTNTGAIGYGSGAPSHRPPEPYRKNQKLPPMQHGTAQELEQQQQAQTYAAEEGGEGGYPGPGAEQLQQQQQQQQQQNTLAQELTGQQSPVGGRSSPMHVSDQPSPASSHMSHGYQQQQGALPPLPGGYGNGTTMLGASKTQLQQQGGTGGGGIGASPYHNRPMRDLQLELAVLKAIKSREDVLERLKVATDKLDTSFGGVAPVVLSPVDPMVRLFYRLVGTLRARTLDAVEALAAWQRRVGPQEPFVYYGVDYMEHIGLDLAFLDAAPFLKNRLTFTRAVDDPFLVEITPDGIPIEEATTCDLRRGGHRFSPEALRIRMARKVLLQYTGRGQPQDGQPELSAVNEDEYPLLGQEPSQPGSGTNDLADSGAEKDTETTAGGSGAVVPLPPIVPAGSPPPAAQPREPSPPTAAGVVDHFPLPQGNDSSGTNGALGSEDLDDASGRGSPDVMAHPVAQPSRLLASEELMLATTTAPETTEAAETTDMAATTASNNHDDENGLEDPTTAETDRAEVADTLAPMAAAAAPTVTSMVSMRAYSRAHSVRSRVEDMDDEQWIDFAVDAMVDSLEPQFTAAIAPFKFTIAGWEIDQQIDDLVADLHTPLVGSQQMNEEEVAALDSVNRTWHEAKVARMSEVQASAVASTSATLYDVYGSQNQEQEQDQQERGQQEEEEQGQQEEQQEGQDAYAQQGDGAMGQEGEEAEGGEGQDETAPRSPLRMHLRPHDSRLSLNLSVDGSRPGTGTAGGDNDLHAHVHAQAHTSADRNALGPVAEDGEMVEAGSGTEAEVEEGNPRSPLRMHMRERGSGISLNLSMDLSRPGTSSTGARDCTSNDPATALDASTSVLSPIPECQPSTAHHEQDPQEDTTLQGEDEAEAAAAAEQAQDGVQEQDAPASAVMAEEAAAGEAESRDQTDAPPSDYPGATAPETAEAGDDGPVGADVAATLAPIAESSHASRAGEDQQGEGEGEGEGEEQQAGGEQTEGGQDVQEEGTQGEGEQAEGEEAQGQGDDDADELSGTQQQQPAGEPLPPVTEAEASTAEDTPADAADDGAAAADSSNISKPAEGQEGEEGEEGQQQEQEGEDDGGEGDAGAGDVSASLDLAAMGGVALQGAISARGNRSRVQSARGSRPVTPREDA